MQAFTQLQGQIISGHGVASGRSAASPYPQGSVAMQAPFFKARGLDLSDCFMGTLNVSIAPCTWKLLQADFCFEHLEWTHLHPPETFSFVRCGVRLTADMPAEDWVNAWLYYPHPETKKAHMQGAHIMEMVAPPLRACTIGSRVELRFDAQHIAVSDRPSQG